MLLGEKSLLREAQAVVDDLVQAFRGEVRRHTRAELAADCLRLSRIAAHEIEECHCRRDAARISYGDGNY